MLKDATNDRIVTDNIAVILTGFRPNLSDRDGNSKAPTACPAVKIVCVSSPSPALSQTKFH